MILVHGTGSLDVLAKKWSFSKTKKNFQTTWQSSSDCQERYEGAQWSGIKVTQGQRARDDYLPPFGMGQKLGDSFEGDVSMFDSFMVMWYLLLLEI